MFTLIRLIFLPAKVGVGSAKLGVKTGYRAGRVLGYRRLTVFAVGVGVGLLVAPVTGAELRDRIRQALDGGAGEPDLAERVRYELQHSPRTWHLPQPIVEVRGQVAVLRGQVPHDVGRADLGRAAGAVAGIAEVDNQIVVAGPGTA